MDPTSIDRDHKAKLDMYASDAVQEAWNDFREAIQPAGAGGKLVQLIEEAQRAAPTTAKEVDDVNRRHLAASGHLQTMSANRYQLLVATIKAELLPNTERPN